MLVINFKPGYLNKDTFQEWVSENFQKAWREVKLNDMRKRLEARCQELADIQYGKIEKDKYNTLLHLTDLFFYCNGFKPIRTCGLYFDFQYHSEGKAQDEYNDRWFYLEGDSIKVRWRYEEQYDIAFELIRLIKADSLVESYHHEILLTMQNLTEGMVLECRDTKVRFLFDKLNWIDGNDNVQVIGTIIGSDKIFQRNYLVEKFMWYFKLISYQGIQ